MSIELFYGNQQTIVFEPSSQQALTDWSSPATAELSDVAAAVAAAFAEPIEFPPLNRAVVPGDTVMLVLDDELPQAATIVAAVVQELLSANIEADHIVVAQTKHARETAADDPRRELPPQVRDRVQRLVHDPEDQESLAFLAANRAGEAVYLNRALCDADFVIPLGCVHIGHWSAERGAFSGVYPSFSNAAAHRQLQQQTRRGEANRKVSPRKLTDEVGWLMGALLTVQVVPAGNDRILHVLCGETQAVMRRAVALYESAWGRSLPGEADLVIASLSGGPGQQTWANVARALAAARQVVTATGCIALCTALTEPPGPGLQLLAETSDPEETRAELEHSSAADAAVAEEVALALEQGSLYLLSQLDDETVESLGIVPLSDPAQVRRLAERFPSSLLLGHAQFALPRGEDQR